MLLLLLPDQHSACGRTDIQLRCRDLDDFVHHAAHPSHCQMIQAGSGEKKTDGWDPQPMGPRDQLQVGMNSLLLLYLGRDSELKKKRESEVDRLGTHSVTDVGGDCEQGMEKKHVLQRLRVPVGNQRVGEVTQEVQPCLVKMKKFGASLGQAAAAARLMSCQTLMP